MAKKYKKEKTPVFSEIIDSKINGYAIGISFLGISTFLLINNTYFHWTILTYFIGAVFGIIGVAGIGTELDKSKKIKGIGNIVIGLLCLGIWVALYLLLKNDPVANSFGMPALIIGAYGFVRGLIELFYSVWIETIKSDRSFSKIAKAVFVLITQLCGLALTVLNILKIFKLI
jgi:hypothetical protein